MSIRKPRLSGLGYFDEYPILHIQLFQKVSENRNFTPIAKTNDFSTSPIFDNQNVLCYSVMYHNKEKGIAL